MASIDLFYLLVEQVFGSVWLAGIGIFALLVLIGMFSRMSQITIIFVGGLFLMTYTIGYIGGIAAMLFGTLAIAYVFWSFINLINSAKS